MDRSRGSERAAASRSRDSLAARIAAAGTLTPTRITAIYVAFGLAALLVSDVVLVRVLSDPLLRHVQAAKGVVEVLLTAALVYLLTAANRISHERSTTELQRHREELRVLHRVLRHNLRNNINVIWGETERLRREATDEDRVGSFDSVVAAAEEIIQYTRRARTIRRLTTDGETATVDLATAIPELLADHELVTDDVAVETTLPERAPVRVSALFDDALAELVANAVEHNDAATPRISIRVDADTGRPGTTTIEVTDNGPGLPEYAETVLRGTEADQMLHLDGMGLWLVYLTVIESGGTFAIERPETGGTTVRLRVPTASDELSGMFQLVA